MLFERKDVTSFRTQAFIFFVLPCGQNPPIHIYASLSNYFMYDALLITYDWEIYCEGSKIVAKDLVYLFLSPPFTHIHLASRTS